MRLSKIGLYSAMMIAAVLQFGCGSNKAVMNSKITHVEKKETLGKGEYYQFEITLEDKMEAIEVDGEWRVEDGGDRKARVMVLDEENFLKFKEEEPYKTQYDSGEKIQHTFKIRLLNQFRAQKTLYYLIVDNPSEEDKKEVSFRLDLNYEWGAGSR